jgi:hypothetical protein
LQGARDRLDDLLIYLKERIELANLMAENFAYRWGMPENAAGHGQQC